MNISNTTQKHRPRAFTRFFAAFCASFFIILSVDCLIPRGEAAVFNSIIRLHVIANSNNESDQNIKLAVRDAIISCSGELFLGVRELPLDQMEQLGEDFLAEAKRVLEENGFSYGATYEWGRESYPTREYDGISFPAGEYYSLRISLGEAKGENWWCVLFPPLCTSAAAAKKQLGETDLRKNDTKVFTEKKYILRFKFLEWFR